MKTILFVCTGNICRSPMAEGLFRHATEGRFEYRVMSAGVGAMEGQSPSSHAVRALREIGIDIAGLRSQLLTAELVNASDYIFGMTHSHVETVMALFPQAGEKTFLLREFDETLDDFEKDISDPIGGSYETYAYCRDQIEQGIFAMLNFIEQAALTAPASAAARTQVAIGSDHSGYLLKQFLADYMRDCGLSVADVGTHSGAASDYIDFAHAVGKKVADAQSAFGVLICATGVGMSMAANKQAGIRAALAGDEATAALARQHNDANVLCLGGAHHAA